MKVVPYLLAQLAFQLSLLPLSALDIEKPNPGFRQLGSAPSSPVSEDWRGVLGPTAPGEEYEAIDRHEMMVSVAALKVPPKAWKVYEKGLAAQRRNDFDAALSHFEAALKVHPEFAIAYEAVGTTLLWQRKPVEAQEAFLRAIAIDPEAFQAELGLGLIMNSTGEFERALDHLQKALYLNGECWQIRYALGRAHYGLGQYLKAELNLKLARAWKPNHPNLYLLLAVVLLDENKRSEAVGEMETFLSMSPDDPLAGEIRARVQELRDMQTE